MRKQMKNVIGIIKLMVTILMILFFSWFALSWIDICLHNGINDGDAGKWNMLAMFINYIN